MIAMDTMVASDMVLVKNYSHCPLKKRPVLPALAEAAADIDVDIVVDDDDTEDTVKYAAHADHVDDDEDDIEVVDADDENVTNEMDQSEPENLSTKPQDLSRNVQQQNQQNGHKYTVNHNNNTVPVCSGPSSPIVCTTPDRVYAPKATYAVDEPLALVKQEPPPTPQRHQTPTGLPQHHQQQRIEGFQPAGKYAMTTTPLSSMGTAASWTGSPLTPPIGNSYSATPVKQQSRSPSANSPDDESTIANRTSEHQFHLHQHHRHQQQIGLHQHWPVLPVAAAAAAAAAAAFHHHQVKEESILSLYPPHNLYAQSTVTGQPHLLHPPHIGAAAPPPMYHHNPFVGSNATTTNSNITNHGLDVASAAKRFTPYRVDQRTTPATAVTNTTLPPPPPPPPLFSMFPLSPVSSQTSSYGSYESPRRSVSPVSSNSSQLSESLSASYGLFHHQHHQHHLHGHYQHQHHGHYHHHQQQHLQHQHPTHHHQPLLPSILQSSPSSISSTSSTSSSDEHSSSNDRLTASANVHHQSIGSTPPTGDHTKTKNAATSPSDAKDITTVAGEKSTSKTSAHYQCPDCSKSYSTYSGLSKHLQFHCPAVEGNQAKKHFCCKNCDKVYTSLGALKMHIRTHTLPCKCDICGKAFSRPWLLQGHIRTHTGEKPFNCQHCHRAFADRSNLRAHLQTHSEIKKYSCTTCAKTFSRMSLLTKHMEVGCPGFGGAPGGGSGYGGTMMPPPPSMSSADMAADCAVY